MPLPTSEKRLSCKWLKINENASDIGKCAALPHSPAPGVPRAGAPLSPGPPRVQTVTLRITGALSPGVLAAVKGGLSEVPSTQALWTVFGKTSAALCGAYDPGVPAPGDGAKWRNIPQAFLFFCPRIALPTLGEKESHREPMVVVFREYFLRSTPAAPPGLCAWERHLQCLTRTREREGERPGLSNS